MRDSKCDILASGRKSQKKYLIHLVAALIQQDVYVLDKLLGLYEKARKILP